jgi:hypothetical protein
MDITPEGIGGGKYYTGYQIRKTKHKVEHNWEQEHTNQVGTDFCGHASVSSVNMNLKGSYHGHI